MPDEKPHETSGARPDVHDHLEPLPELPHDELEPLEELPAAPAAEGGGDGSAPDEEHQRSLERAHSAAEQAAAAIEAGRAHAARAPLLLKKAAMIVAAGCLVPFMSWGSSLGLLVGSKLLVVAAAYLFHVGVLARSGEKVDPTLRKLAQRTFVDLTRGPKNLLEQIVRFAPTPLHLIAWALMLGGIALSFQDPDFVMVLSAEVLMLAWAAATLVHIDSFERGHKFNPLLPLGFLGHAVAALVSFSRSPNLIQIAGAVAVAGGGLFAMYTMFLAMKQAKVQGELKKRAAAEHRKLERSRRKGPPAA